MATKTIATNKKARRNYTILETFEAGIVLRGSEVKSLREAQARLDEGFVRIDDNNEAWLHGVTISPYKNLSSHYELEADRVRKLLLSKTEIVRLRAKVEQQSLTIVPTKMYFRAGKAKVEIGLGKGKKLHDKRADIKERDQKRDAQRELAQRNRG